MGDPNKPKKGLSAYMFFGKEVRADVIAKECNGNGSKVTEVMKAIAARWAKLDAKEKEKFERLSAQDKERYEKEIAEYRRTAEAMTTMTTMRRTRSRRNGPTVLTVLPWSSVLLLAKHACELQPDCALEPYRSG